MRKISGVVFIVFILTLQSACGKSEKLQARKAYGEDKDSPAMLDEIKNSLFVKTCKQNEIKSPDTILLKAIIKVSNISDSLTCEEQFSAIRETKKLQLQFQNISSISILRDFKSLEDLDISKNFIDSIDDLGSLENLQNLNSSENLLENVDVLRNFEKLESLILADNKISSIPNLTRNSKMSFMEISGNRLDSVVFLKNLTNLKTLSFMDNLVTDVSPLTELGILQVLQINRNPISKAKCLSQLKSSKYENLRFACNQLED